MKVQLTDTTANAVASRLERLRVEGGAIALGRVLTLVIVLDGAARLDEAIKAADSASMEHPCRVLVLARTRPRPGGINAEIRVGGDAGASETVILSVPPHSAGDLDTLLNPLLLPDAPIVAWWPGEPPEVPSADPVGLMATKRIIDTAQCADPVAALAAAARGYRPGDIDLAWTRITLWRAQLAAAFGQDEDAPVREVQVTGSAAHPSCYLLLAWLAAALDCPGTFEPDAGASAITSALIAMTDRCIELRRPEGSDLATLAITGEVPHEVALQARTLSDCLAEELRSLDPDEVFGALARQWLTVIEAGDA